MIAQGERLAHESAAQAAAAGLLVRPGPRAAGRTNRPVGPTGGPTTSAAAPAWP